MEAEARWIRYGTHLFDRYGQLGGVVAYGEDDADRRDYAVAWVEGTPDDVRDAVRRVIEGIWMRGFTIFHEAASSLAPTRVAMGDPIAKAETDDLQAFAELELAKLIASEGGAADGD